MKYFVLTGAAPIATLNLQHCGESYDIPDAWHHQMIFGVGQAGIYLTNPLECLSEQVCTINKLKHALRVFAKKPKFSSYDVISACVAPIG